ncbi:MAG: hypothetical protein ACOC44_01240 [Promethearchaeia archaeon]
MCLKIGDEKKDILKQKVQLKKKISNRELFLIQYFHEITQIHPNNVIICKPYILFFVENAYYFRCKKKLWVLRQKRPAKKVLIIRNETNLLKLLFGFFPDIFIDDIRIKIQEEGDLMVIIVKLLTYRERMIAIGADGQYIKILNEIINRFFKFEFNYKRVIIVCEVQ